MSIFYFRGVPLSEPPAERPPPCPFWRFFNDKGLAGAGRQVYPWINFPS